MALHDNKILFVLFIILLIAATTTLSSAQSCSDLNEPNDSFNTATAITDGQYIDACIDTTTDSDWYTFTGTAGEVIVASALAAAVTPGTCVDPFFILYDTTGMVILDSDDDGGVDRDSQIQFIVPIDGTYFLEVTESPFGSCTGAYQMCLQAVSCEDNDFGDDSTAAFAISYGDSMSGCISTADDVDWFTFTATGKNEVEVKVMAAVLVAPSEVDPVLTLYSMDTTTVIEENDDNGSLVDSKIATVLPGAGTYFLKIEGLSSSTGHYILTLALSDTISGQILYDQITTVTATGNGIPSQEFEVSQASFNSEGADDFEIPITDGGWRISSLMIAGRQTLGPPPEVTSVDVSFYEDANGLPGTLITTQTDIIPLLAEADDDLFVTMTTPVDLPGGKKYWLSVVIDADFNTYGSWFWRNTADINGDEYTWQNPNDGFATGCTTWDTGSNCGAGGASQGNPRDAMFSLCGELLDCSDFAVLADKIINFSSFAEVEGNVHSNRDINFSEGLPSSLTGNITAVRDINVQNDNFIVGNIIAGGTVAIDTGATVNGTVTANSHVTASPISSLGFGPFNGGDFRVAANGEATISPGTYDVVRCSTNAILHMSSGTYEMDRFVIDSNSQLKLDLTGGDIIIRVDERFLFRAGSETIIESATGSSEDIFIQYDGTDKMFFAKDSRHLGNVLAPTSRVKFGTRASFLGSLCAKRIDLNGRVQIWHHSISDSIPRVIAEDAITGTNQPVTDFVLSENYPNPFGSGNPLRNTLHTNIKFALSNNGIVKLQVYNLLGKQVKTLVNARRNTGRYEEIWDGRNQAGEFVSAGTYIYRLAFQQDDGNLLVLTKKMLFLK